MALNSLLDRIDVLYIPNDNTGEEDSLRPIINCPGDSAYYGKSFHNLWQILLPFLQECIADCDSALEKMGIELGCADGKIIWKALNTGIKMYAYDQSTEELKLLEEKVYKRTASRTNCLTLLPGNCFDILSSTPELEGKFHVLHSQNLIHFFNVIQCGIFAELVYRLLAPGGKAYITVNTIPQHEPDTLALYTKSKESGAPFPDNMVHRIEKSYLRERILTSKTMVIGMANPHESGEYKLESEEDRATLRRTYRCVSNLFDTDSLIRLFSKVGLIPVDCFYMDASGMTRSPTMDSHSTFSSIFLQKPRSSS